MYTHISENRNKILISEINEDYKIEFKTDSNFKPELLVTSTDEDSIYKGLISNNPLHKIEFVNIKEFKEYKKNHKNIGNDLLYGDISPEYQYIRKYFKNQKKFKSRFWFLDIETDIPDDGFPNPETTPVPITLIQISENDSDTNYMFGWLKTLKEKPNRKYFYFNNEKEMLEGFISYMHLRTPTITTAWNGDGFDYPYIVNRMEKLGIDVNTLSPFGILEEHRAVVFGKDLTIRKPVGYVWLDYIEMFKKADPSGKESWSLEYISKYVLGDEEGGKLDYTKSGFKNMRDFIKGNYNPNLDENNSLKEFYNTNNFEQEQYNLFCEYGEQDTVVLKKIDIKLGLCEMLVNYAHNMGTNIYDVFATIKPWTIYIWNELYERNQFLANKSPFETYHTVGGHVEANPGLHKWVISEDYTSLYPFCMICLNLSPETYIERENVPNELQKLTESFYRYSDEENKIYSEDIYESLPDKHKQLITLLLQKHNLIMAPNGTFYKKDVLGIVPELVKNIFFSRKAYKKKMLEAKGKVEEAKSKGEDYLIYQDEVNVNDTNQYVEKIKINSLYGAVAASTSIFANSDISNAITGFGRYNIKTMIKKIIEKINLINNDFNVYLVQADTDSMYISLESVVNWFKKQKPEADRETILKFIEGFMNKVITPSISEVSSLVAKQFNTYEDSLAMDAEIIADVFISTGKKRYAARIWWDEGNYLAKPKKKITGLDIKRSSTPNDARIKLGTILDYIFEDDNNALISMISNYEKELKTLPIDKIAIPSGISDITKYENVTKAVPMHVRASLVFNNYIEKHNMNNYQRINNGDKIKYIFLKKNPITTSDVIGFNDVDFLFETGLDKFVDYSRLFERTFLTPVKGLTDAISWETKKSGTIKKLF